MLKFDLWRLDYVVLPSCLGVRAVPPSRECLAVCFRHGFCPWRISSSEVMVLNCIVSPSSPVGMVPRDARAPPTNQGLSDAMRLRFCLTMWGVEVDALDRDFESRHDVLDSTINLGHSCNISDVCSYLSYPSSLFRGRQVQRFMSFVDCPCVD